MNPRDNFIKALRREKITGHVPHFELVMFLTMESIGRVHPLHRSYVQWGQMSTKEKRLHLTDMALAYIEIAEKYNHSAIFVHPNPGPNGEICDNIDSAREILQMIRELSGDKYFLMLHGDPTFPIPDGDNMVDFSIQLYEEPELIHEESKQRLEWAMKLCDAMSAEKGLVDGWALCSDYCLNANPFYTREMFEEFITPYLSQSIEYYRSKGQYTIKHTDGNVTPILDLIVDCKPDAIHSMDPQGNVSLSEGMKLYGDRVTFCGNVNCGLLQTGTEEEVIADTKRSLREGMETADTGYIFCSSNCAYTGLPLERYELMHKIWREEGIYK